uniref:Paralemmin 3 n=1 Tax=Lates calcarifer TaxID=8187 RepID=A0A4W6FTY1_LATCA
EMHHLTKKQKHLTLEKRRQQDEEDRVRREMEDEKLRLQQLKRKSLRDQWLMEGAPLSPTSLDAQSPRSPLWGPQAQEIEKHIDKYSHSNHKLRVHCKYRFDVFFGVCVCVCVHNYVFLRLQSESQRLAEEKEKEQMEDGQAVRNLHTHTHTHTHTHSPTHSVDTKGAGICVKQASLVFLRQSLVRYQMSAINENEEEEGTLVIRAECVIITDEGDDVPEDLKPQEDQQETMQAEETPLPSQEAGKEGEEDVEEVIKTEAFTQPEKNEEPESTAEAQPTSGNGGESDIKTNENGDGETKANGQDKQSEASVQSPATALEDTAVASVPVYSEAQTSTLTPNTDGEAATSPEGAEAALKSQDPASMPGQFQEVPLADPQENQRTEAGEGEQEPLLPQAKAPNTQADPTRASQGEETEAPKRKTCQCCSVM